jgi:hypothetical protein
MKWLKIWLLAPSLLLMGIAVNEGILRKAAHQPSVVSDANLFCDVYSQVNKLSNNDVILLGASRMQADFDLSVFYQHFPTKKAILLALSGRGTSYPVFKDIVKNTNFRGIVIIDETEHTLMEQKSYDQQSFIDYCHTSFSFNRQLNHRISAWLQSKLVFLNPQSSSLRLWGNLLTKNKLPVPFYSKTLFSREQLLDYKRADEKFLKELHDSRLNGIKSQVKPTFLTPDKWLNETKHWGNLVNKFRARGGRIIFVRMPLSEEIWKFESQITPPEKYWEVFTNKLNVKSLYFADYPDLSNFEFPDTSHLDMRDKPVFTHLLLNHLQNELKTN